MHNFNYIWNLSDIPQPTRGKVFSCFACGGGSTMGYKLAEFDVVGCNELDPRMAALYEKNLHPRHMFVEDIRDFVKRNEYPPELYNLDILDGSPPCSSFSMCGAREKMWGVEHKFREGQKSQVLDTLFFDYIELAKKLQPKCVVAENVVGITRGNAKKYLQKIIQELNSANYYVSVHVLDASRMGVPQKRKRLFFICLRRDLICKIPDCTRDLFGIIPTLNMCFHQEPITFRTYADYKGDKIKENSISYKYWKIKKDGDHSIKYTRLRVEGRGGFFNHLFVPLEHPLPTITASGWHKMMYWDKPIFLSKHDIITGSSFPQDYDFAGNNPCYVCGMSVPPVMIANIADRLYNQWLKYL